jgi:hypothetical protein
VSHNYGFKSANQHVKEIEDFYNKVEGSKRAPPPAEQKVRLESEEVVAASPDQKDEVEVEDWDVEVAAEQKAKRESEEEDKDVEITSKEAKQQKVENGEADQESGERTGASKLQLSRKSDVNLRKLLQHRQSRKMRPSGNPRKRTVMSKLRPSRKTRSKTGTSKLQPSKK